MMTRPKWWEWLVLASALGTISAILVPIFLAAKAKAPRSSCLSNVKIQGAALLMYSQDYDDQFPATPDRWMNATYPYVKQWLSFHCPVLKETEFGYAFNGRLAGKSPVSLANPTMVELSFESVDCEENASGGSELFSTRHHGFGSVAFADGHGKALSQKVFHKLPAPVWQETKRSSVKQ